LIGKTPDVNCSVVAYIIPSNISRCKRQLHKLEDHNGFTILCHVLYILCVTFNYVQFRLLPLHYHVLYTK